MTLNLETTLKEGLRLRSATLDDAAAVAKVWELHYGRLIGREDRSPEQTRDMWQFPGFDLESDVQLAVNNDDLVVGYVAVWNTSPPHVKSWVLVLVHPEFHGQGIGTALTRWGETRARERIHLAPADAEVVIGCGVYDFEDDSCQLLENEGFVHVRNFYQMRIDMDEAPPEPKFSDHIRVTTHAELDDLLRVIRADTDGFRDHYGFVEEPEDDQFKEWQHWIASNPHHDSTLWFLAMDGEEIAGVCLCEPRMDEDPDMAYVDSLAVRRNWRKQGIALGLMHHAFGEIYRRGIKKVSLHVDASSLTGATRLYEKAGMSVYRNSKRYEKILRDGKDYRTQSVEE